MPHEKIQELLRVDYEADMALVVLTRADDRGEMVGIAHYSNDPRTNFADAAFLVRDDHQGLGMGTTLLNRLVDVAMMNGIAGFTADVLIQNHGMLRVFHKCGFPIASELADGVYHLNMPFKKRRKRHEATA